jgi:uncharacterized DUF497 family protein
VREIRWTEESEDHIARHGVVPVEVEQVLYSRPRLITKGREDVTLVFGTTDAGRHLVVVLADADDGRLFVVTARAMADPERRAFARRAR